MKLAVSSALLALALIQAPETLVAFAPRFASRRDGVLQHLPRQHASLMSLGMVGFKDLHEKESAEAVKALSRLNYETSKVWQTSSSRTTLTRSLWHPPRRHHLGLSHVAHVD